MVYKQPSIDIIESIINSLDFTVEIINIINLTGGFHTIEVKNMFHAQPGFPVTIGTKTYTIVEVTPAVISDCGPSSNDLIKVQGDADDITEETFDLYRPFFFFGTPIAEGVELRQINQAKEKIPMFWLRLDDFSETFYEDILEKREREIKIRLYPLTQGDPDKWLTRQAIEEGVNPMRRLAELFIDKINSNPNRFDADGLTWSIPAVYPKFGVIIINKGVEKSLWHDKLSGVELSMNLTVFKKFNC